MEIVDETTEFENSTESNVAAVNELPHLDVHCFVWLLVFEFSI